MDGLIRQPGGCFEQTSSTNWPNVAILSYLEAHGGDPRLKVQSAQALKVGYDKLTGYQVDAGGFETWGSGPGKEALSAFGLLQFRDMSNVYDVDPNILDRDAKYLVSQRDGKGGFRNTGESAHGYGSAPANVLNGFITFALAETGHGDKIEKEIKTQVDVSKTTNDPYVLALATRTLLVTGDPAGAAASKRLGALQAKDGSYPGAESSITRSYEANLVVESTALATLAMIKAGDRGKADKGAEWLVENRQAGGTWGASQATGLALQALSEHAEMSKIPQTAGALQLVVNGETVGTLQYEADEMEPLTLSGWSTALKPGTNTIVLTQLRGEPLPFGVDVNWSSTLPVSAPGAELTLSVDLTNGPVVDDVHSPKRKRAGRGRRRKTDS